MIRFLLFAVFVLSSAAFSDGITRIVLPSGDSGYSVTCENSPTVNKCYEMAGGVCIYGYDIVKDAAEKKVIVHSAFGVRVDSVISGKAILVQCKRDAEIQAAKKAYADSVAAAKAEHTREALAEWDKHPVRYTLWTAAMLTVAAALFVGVYFAVK